MNRAELKTRYGEEQVLIIDAHLCYSLPEGVTPLVEEVFAGLQQKTRYLPRWQVEHNPAYRQLIPYVILKQGSDLLLTRRKATQGESRLHHLYSLGIGGHINPQDGESCGSVSAAMQRELQEELACGVWMPPAAAPSAFINDLSNDVSRDHLGILYVLEVPTHIDIDVRETDKMQALWVSAQEVAENYLEQLESWSQLAFSYLRDKKEVL